MPEAAFMRAFAGRLAPLRTRLLALVGVSVVPVVIVSFIGVALIEAEQRRVVETDLVHTARALSSAIDGELGNSIAAAQILANAPSLQVGDFKRFAVTSSQSLNVNPRWQSIELSDREGRILLHVGGKDGEASPTSLESRSLHAVLDTGRPQVSSLVSVPGMGFRFLVRLPVVVDGQTRYVLSAGVKPESLLPVLERQKLEQGAVVAVFDANLLVVARTRAHEKFVGNSITGDLRELLSKADEGWTPSVALDKVRTYVAFSRSSSTGWGVTYGVARESIDAPLRRTYTIMGVGILLSLLLGIVAAALVARQIAASISALKQAATSLGEGRSPVLEEIPITELDEMARALSQAAHARLHAEASRDAALEDANAANANKDALLALLTRSNAELQRFAYVASHDLQAPLRSVTTFAELLQKATHGRLSSQEEDWLQRVLVSGRRMHTLVADLLSYARLESETLQPVAVDLNEVLQSTLDLIAGLARESDAKVTHAELPSVMGNHAELQQLMLNLLTNAIHYRSSEPPRIDVSAERQGDRWLVCVRDNGIGIDSRHHREIFDIFRRIDPSRPGTGIGLALCRRIVERAGGTIWVESALQSGSTFKFTLPAVPEA